MLKLAYQLGVKLAFAEEVAPTAGPAELLAQALQELPDAQPVEEKKRRNKPIGKPDDPEVTFSPESSFSFDSVGSPGLEEQGPWTTSI